MSKLHWSLDYSNQRTEKDSQGEFSQILSGALSSSPVVPDAAKKTHRYTLLPNFGVGFKRDSRDDPSMQIGHAIVGRRVVDQGFWQYRVEHENSCSGEELTLDFTCGDEPDRPLRDVWRIRARNSADGSYSSISLNGAWDEQRDGSRSVKLTTKRGLSISAGTVPPGAALTCNWALFDILPSFQADHPRRLAILEDLEVLKDDCQIRPLEEWTFENGGDRHKLMGYSVFGTGLPPSYCWLTESGDVAAFSTMLATYVLTERQSEN